MKRRDFMKAMGALGMTTVAPSLFTDKAFLSSVQASPAIQSANVSITHRTPQVINIFLYGGASELAGNLSNIADLNVHSQSKYAGQTALNPVFTASYDEAAALNNPNADVGQRTPNNFWANAGGIIMEDMLHEGDMTIYRTCNRKKHNTRAHRPSIFSGQKGTLDIDSAPGLGTTLASIIANNPEPYTAEFGVPALEELVMPMVSFEGESTTFAIDPNATSPVPLALKPVGLSANFDNPYQRGNQPVSAATLDALVDSKMKANPGSVQGDSDYDDLTVNYGQRYKKVSESFLNHRKLATIVNRFNNLVNDQDSLGNPSPSLPFLPEQDPDGSNAAFDLDLHTAFVNAVAGTGRFYDHQDPPVAYGSEQNGLDVSRIVRQVVDPATGNLIDALDALGNPIIDTYFIDLATGARITNPDGSPLVTLGDTNNDPRLEGGPGSNRLEYPANNRFAELLRAAVTLCIHNPDTKLAMVGSPGLGGWDDHNSAMMSYEARMQTLMSAVRAAIKHIKYAIDDPAVIADRGAGPANDTSNIIINIFTDFGRNANLNNSQGWDHGNNQNFYTFGGRPLIRLDPALGEYTLSPAELSLPAADLILPVRNYDHSSVNQASRTEPSAVRPAGALGKIVGETSIFGSPGQNRLFTKPLEAGDNVDTGSINELTYGYANPASSYEFEPQAIASTIYSWFGVTNPDVLTQNDHNDFATGSITRMGTDGNGTLIEETVARSAGEPPIDERVAGITLSASKLTVKNIAV
ncbi:MAG: hypothetical protein OEY29_01140 [Gammaproteobacteria bacterium]|nr:hypothetical protein [Gammaproteobacteria bacterium]